ncbi:polysaccharide pyruvyl transferase family protein [Enterococcus hailinensis]|uniref:polysaccharide pyruvyl transferase family protein n=1 Tax=Enterococcus hailinensis TaxID=3238988 RepID=UPI0038B3A777
MKNVLIDNCVPLNNGDAALVFGLSNALKKKNYKIEFSCLNYTQVKSKYPEYRWHKSRIGTFFYRACFWKNKFTFIWKLYTFINLVFLKNEYKKADNIISAPGGYIHSYYGIEARMFILYICKKWLKKQVGIYSQSIGSLSDRDKRFFYKYGKDLDYILVRDELSYNRALSYGNFKNLVLTKDAAFLLGQLTKSNFTNKNKDKQVAISVREWAKEGRSMDSYFNLIDRIVKRVLSYGYKITFLSTCQGIDDYVDDSIVAKEFINKYGYADNAMVAVDDSYHTLEELQQLIQDNFEFVIGTRLHMCILSIINGVPALNISYEEKGRECYKYLDIEEFSVDFNNEESIDIIDSFINMSDFQKKQLFENVSIISQEQQDFINYFFE